MVMEVVMGRGLWIEVCRKELVSQVESGRGGVIWRFGFWQAARIEQGLRVQERESLDIWNLCPLPQSLTVIVKIRIILGSMVTLGNRLYWLSKGY